MLTITELSTPVTRQVHPPGEIWHSIQQVNADELGKILKFLKYPLFLRTPYWFAVSSVVKERAGNRCQMCNSPENTQAHHRTYEHRGFEHLHMGDLVCVCEKCHKQHHKPEIIQRAREAAWRRKATRDEQNARDGIIILKKRHISACRTKAGGFRKETYRLLTGDITWPQPEGWIKRLRGLRVTQEVYEAALRSAKA